MHIVANGWFSGRLSTGSGQYLQHLAQVLPQIAPGHRYTIVVPVAGQQVEPARFPGWQLVPLSSPFDGRQKNLSKLWFEQVAFPRACNQVGADLAFVPYWGAPLRSPCRLVVTVHDLIPLVLPGYRRGGLQRGYTALVSTSARRADSVITDSHASKADIVSGLAIPEQRIHAIHLAADSRYRPVTDPDDLARVGRVYRLPDRYFLYLGGFDARKNVTRLIGAYARFISDYPRATVPPWLVVAGRLPDRDSDFFPDPRPVVQSLGIAERVQFIGYVEEEDKPALYSRAAAFLFPSRYEGYGLPVAEAAACATPVITSSCSSLPEVTPSATLVDPEDETAMAVAMAQVLAQQPPPADAARRTWQDVARETLAVLTATRYTKG